jgi:hypothetical protein
MILNLNLSLTERLKSRSTKLDPDKAIEDFLQQYESKTPQINSNIVKSDISDSKNDC